ncbi:MAG: Alkaline phosphatase synthesis transcriptional regulatory protein PhoP [Phycisphaerae bacterium]|nr:Alkaline phosphatase synthesis transcriptional regulatory protein PhoP [Phycisphaerae bacterium]
MAKILLIDDDVDFVEVNKALLESSNHQVVYAHNGDDGKRLAVAEKPDVVILDVMMTTRTEGFHVARDLRANPATRNIPIVMLTAVNQEVPWKFGPDEVWLPVDEFMEKPVRPDALLAAVKKATEK